MADTREVTPLGRLLAQAHCVVDAAACDEPALLKNAVAELERDLEAYRRAVQCVGDLREVRKDARERAVEEARDAITLTRAENPADFDLLMAQLQRFEDAVRRAPREARDG